MLSANTTSLSLFGAATPGAAFGEAGNDFIRISYATSQERIKEALRRMEAVIKKE